MGKRKSAQLSGPVQKPTGKPRGRPFTENDSRINPGGQSKEKRAFLERLRAEDADEVYDALMDLVRERNAPAVLRAVEYIAGKPPEIVKPAPSSPQDLQTIELDLARLPTSVVEAIVAEQKRLRDAAAEGLDS